MKSIFGKLITNPKRILIHQANSKDLLGLFQLLATSDCRICLVNFRVPSREVSGIARNFAADLIISEQVFDPTPQGIDVLSIDELRLSELDQIELKDLSADVTFFTSGTTGSAKSVSFSLQSLMVRAKAFMEWQDFAPRQVHMTLPLASIGGLNLFLRALAVDAEVLLDENIITEDSMLALMPSQLKAYSDEKLRELAKAGSIIVGGEKVDSVLEKIVRQYHLPVHYAYGMSEAGGTLALRSPLSNGYTFLPDVDFRLAENRLSIKNSLRQDYLLTDDFVVLDDNDQILEISRGSRFINRGGFKYSLNALESEISKLFGGAELACVKIPDSEWGEIAVCFLIKNKVDLSVLDDLPVYKRPKISFLDAIPVSSSGKIDYIQLEKTALEA